jgi:hypothetical protein
VHLEKLGIVRETSGSKYGRLYAYDRHLTIRNAESWSVVAAAPSNAGRPWHVAAGFGSLTLAGTVWRLSIMGRGLRLLPACR